MPKSLRSFSFGLTVILLKIPLRTISWLKLLGALLVNDPINSIYDRVFCLIRIVIGDYLSKIGTLQNWGNSLPISKFFQLSCFNSDIWASFPIVVLIFWHASLITYCYCLSFSCIIRGDSFFRLSETDLFNRLSS